MIRDEGDGQECRSYVDCRRAWKSKVCVNRMVGWTFLSDIAVVGRTFLSDVAVAGRTFLSDVAVVGRAFLSDEKSAANAGVPAR